MARLTKFLVSFAVCTAFTGGVVAAQEPRVPLVEEGEAGAGIEAAERLKAAIDGLRAKNAEFQEGRQAMNTRLNLAAEIAEQIKKTPIAGPIILDVDYFQAQLKKSFVDDVIPLGEDTQKPNLLGTALFAAMNSAANAHPEGTDVESFVAAWRAEQGKFLLKITSTDPSPVGGIQEAPEAGLHWNAFLNVWMKDALFKDRERFPEALRQASVIVPGLLYGLDEASIQDVLNGTLEQKAVLRGGGDQVIGHGFLSVWHERRKASLRRKIDRIRNR